MMNANFIGLLMDYSLPVANQPHSAYARHETGLASVHAIRQQAKRHRSRYLSKLLKK